MSHYHARPCASCGRRLIHLDNVYQNEDGGSDSVVALYRCEGCNAGTGMRHLFAESPGKGIMPVLEVAVTAMDEFASADARSTAAGLVVGVPVGTGNLGGPTERLLSGDGPTRGTPSERAGS